MKANEKPERRYHLQVRNRFDNGGSLSIMNGLDRYASDYNDIVAIGRRFAEMGHEVQVLSNIHYKNQDYDKYFGLLKGTKYYKKCPDLRVDNKMYEYEGFVGSWNKRKLSRMISHGAKQSPFIIIKNTKGCSDRFILRRIRERLNDPNYHHAIKEVWVYEKGKIRLLFEGL